MKGSWRGTLAAMIVGLCLFTHQSPAQEKSEKILRFPIGCYNKGFKFEYFNTIFQPTAVHQKQTIYFVHNLSNQNVELLQVRTGDEPYVMHVNGLVGPNLWSVYATDEKYSKYICAVKDPKMTHLKVIDCSKVLDICEFPWTRFGDNHRGNYWPVFNQTRTGAKVAMRWHGVILIDPKAIQAYKHQVTPEELNAAEEEDVEVNESGSAHIPAKKGQKSENANSQLKGNLDETDDRY